MPALVCSAQNCAYNNAMYCGRDDIKIDGETFDQKYYYCLLYTSDAADE